MPELKFDTKNIEILFLKNRRVFITLFVLSSLVVILATVWLLYALGLIFNNTSTQVNYNLGKTKTQENYSILTDFELKKINSDKKISIFNQSKESLAIVLNENSKPVSITTVFDKKIDFSPQDSIATMVVNSPYFLFLDKSSKKDIYNISKSKTSNIKSIDNVYSIVTDSEYILHLDSVAKDKQSQDIVSNYYAKIFKKDLTGFVNYNKQYNYSFNTDNYKSSYPSKFFENYGLYITNDKFTPRVKNYSTIYQNLALIQPENLTNFKQNNVGYFIDQNFNPTFLNPQESKDDKQLEEIKIPEDLDPKINEFNLLSLQLNNKNLENSAIIDNYKELINKIVNTLTHGRILESNINYRETVKEWLINCHKENTDPLKIFSCLNKELTINFNKFLSYTNNVSTQTYLEVIQNSILKQLNNETKYFGIYKTSPEASFMAFLDPNVILPASVKLKPIFSTSESKFNNSILTFDGSFEVMKETNVDNSYSITFNKLDYFINLELGPKLSTDYYCTNDLDLIKIENSLYKSQKPKWENNKLEFENSLNYYKTDSKVISNLKTDTSIGLKKLSEPEGKLFKNCFANESLGVQFNDSILKITASKINSSALTETQILQIDDFVKSLTIQKK